MHSPSPLDERMYTVTRETLITPFSRQTRKSGMSYFSTVTFDFGTTDIIEELDLALHTNDEVQRYFVLSLGENSSPFDSYLVACSDVKP